MSLFLSCNHIFVGAHALFHELIWCLSKLPAFVDGSWRFGPRWSNELRVRSLIDSSSARPTAKLIASAMHSCKLILDRWDRSGGTRRQGRMRIHNYEVILLLLLSAIAYCSVIVLYDIFRVVWCGCVLNSLSLVFLPPLGFSMGEIVVARVDFNALSTVSSWALVCHYMLVESGIDSAAIFFLTKTVGWDILHGVWISLLVEIDWLEVFAEARFNQVLVALIVVQLKHLNAIVVGIVGI